MSATLEASHAEPTSCYDHIELKPGDPACTERSYPKEFKFISSYQGQFDFSHHNLSGRIHYRNAKVPWRFSWLKPEDRYWNFDTKEEFENNMNANYNMATNDLEPLNQEMLDLFRKEVAATAITGFFCHIRKKWVPCKPTFRSPSRRTSQIQAAREERLAKIPAAEEQYETAL